MSVGIRAELRLHPDAQSLEDEWSGITDPLVRRKLQNRLNQRAARRRKAAARLAGGEDLSDDSPPSDSSATPIRPAESLPLRWRGRISINDFIHFRARVLRANEWQAAAKAPQMDPSALDAIRSNSSGRHWYDVILRNRLVEIESHAVRLQQERDNSWLYPLPNDHLITLVSYNVYRALATNMAMLGLDLAKMYEDDYPSPFLPLSQTASSKISNLPLSLQPTELQKTVAHHPEWDIVPYAEMRDNILRYGEENIDDIELCLDIVGDGSLVDPNSTDGPSRTGLIVWGEPWDASSWEITESFARKYSFLLKGAISAQTSTNHWRMLRDEPPLDFDRIAEEAAEAARTRDGYNLHGS